MSAIKDPSAIIEHSFSETVFLKGYKFCHAFVALTYDKQMSLPKTNTHEENRETIRNS
jgi:hypothetical protein